MFGFLQPLIATLPLWVILTVLTLGLGGLGYIAFNFLAIQKFFQEFGGLFKELFGLLIPSKWDSAKTLILLSIFSWAMSSIVSNRVQNIIAFIGWLFLMGGVHWVMHEEKKLKETLTINKIFIGPWITGALICYFLFATPERIPAIAYILWPIISAIIAAIPRFIGSDSVYQTPKWIKPKPEDRQYVVNLALINLLLSCWIQLGFTTQTWVADYPSLRADNLSNSAFVINTSSGDGNPSRAIDILTRAETEVKAELGSQSWSQVERWLLNFEEQVEQLESRVISQLPQARENNYWSLQGRILAGEYNIQLFSVWQGPSSDGVGYYYSKICQISRVVPADLTSQPTSATTPLPITGNSKVQCSPAEGPTRGQPDSKLPE